MSAPVFFQPGPPQPLLIAIEENISLCNFNIQFMKQILATIRNHGEMLREVIELEENNRNLLGRIRSEGQIIVLRDSTQLVGKVLEIKNRVLISSLKDQCQHALSLLDHPQTAVAGRSLMQQLADQNYPLAQYHLGCLLLNGIAGEQNEAAARRYFERASKYNDNAQVEYCLMLCYGIGGPEDKETAKANLLETAQKQHPLAMFAYASILNQEQDFEEERKWLKQAAERGHIGAIFFYGEALVDGRGGPKDIEQAKQFLQKSMHIPEFTKPAKALLERIKRQQIAFGRVVQTIENTSSRGKYYHQFVIQEKKERTQALSMLIDKACQDDLDAAYEYTCARWLGKWGEITIDRKPELALRLMEKIAEAEFEAKIMYATMLWLGKGLKSDEQKAKEYMQQAADQDNFLAKFCYAVMLQEKPHEDLERAAKYMGQAALKGVHFAVVEYANMLLTGQGIEKDEKKAREFLKQHTKEDNLEALFAYYSLVRDGVGGYESHIEARKSFKKLANESNMPEAQYAYAMMVKKGEGGSQNQKEARKYLELAARQEHPEAQRELRAMLRQQRQAQADTDPPQATAARSPIPSQPPAPPPHALPPTQVFQTPRPHILSPAQVFQAARPHILSPAQVFQAARPHVLSPAQVFQAARPHVLPRPDFHGLLPWFPPGQAGQLPQNVQPLFPIPPPGRPQVPPPPGFCVGAPPPTAASIGKTIPTSSTMPPPLPRSGPQDQRAKRKAKEARSEQPDKRLRETTI